MTCFTTGHPSLASFFPVANKCHIYSILLWLSSVLTILSPCSHTSTWARLLLRSGIGGGRSCCWFPCFHKSALVTALMCFQSHRFCTTIVLLNASEPKLKVNVLLLTLMIQMHCLIQQSINWCHCEERLCCSCLCLGVSLSHLKGWCWWWVTLDKKYEQWRC